MPSDVRVLLVDDERMVRDNLVAYLEDDGFYVAAVALGEEGLQALHQGFYDVAIVDMRLPDMSGNNFIRRAISRYEHLHFIIHTGSLEYQLPEDLLSLGVSPSNVLHKPVGDLSDLVGRLRVLMPALRV